MDRGGSRPIVITVEMGYGHLRAAFTLANSLGTHVVRMDLPPIAGPAEKTFWRGARGFYNALSRAGDWPLAGAFARRILEQITLIESSPHHATIVPATLLTRCEDFLMRELLCRRFRTWIFEDQKTVLATYPAAALAARQIPGARVFCLVTDTDLNRAWVAVDAGSSCVEYFAPVDRVADRLRSFGVPDQNIHLTGYPLADGLTDDAETALARRLLRLDPESKWRDGITQQTAVRLQRLPWSPVRGPVSVTLAVGGAGAQIRQIKEIAKSLRGLVMAGSLRLTLVAGTRSDVATRFDNILQSVGLIGSGRPSPRILFAEESGDYFRKFEDCLIHTDVLWTKPSELVFYAALGLPMLLAPPVGGQEKANRDWILSRDAALDAGEPAEMGQRIASLLAGGELARIAWNAYSRLDREGLGRIRAFLNSCHSDNPHRRSRIG